MVSIEWRVPFRLHHQPAIASIAPRFSVVGYLFAGMHLGHQWVQQLAKRVVTRAGVRLLRSSCSNHGFGLTGCTDSRRTQPLTSLTNTTAACPPITQASERV